MYPTDQSLFHSFANASRLVALSMRLLSTILFLLTLVSCNSGPEIPDIVYKQGDIWVDNFRNNNFPAKVVKDDRLYCSSLAVGGINFLYCLNLKTGRVDWATEVDNWASAQPIITDNFIYFISFVGDIYKFDKHGKPQWKTKLEGSFSDFTINPNTNNLFVQTVDNGVVEYEFNSGKKLNNYGKGMLGITLPVFEKDRMFIAGISSNSNNSLKTLLAINKKNTKIVLKDSIGDFVDKIFVRKNQIFYVDGHWRLNCLNLNTGGSIWQTKQLLNRNGFMTRNPHLIFFDTTLIFYDSDLRYLKEINLANGNIIRENSYQDFIKSGILKSSKKSYIVNINKDRYTIILSNTLTTPVDLKEAVEVQIEGTTAKSRFAAIAGRHIRQIPG